MQYRKNLNADWGMVMQAEYDQLLRGRQESDLPGSGTDKHTQNSVFGLKLKVDAVKKLPNNRAISFGPYMHYWDIKDSEKDTSLTRTGRFNTSLEPHNKTWETGLAVKYHF